MSSSLASFPDELIVEEARRREREAKKDAPEKQPRTKERVCLGCGREFNARDMRTHPCKVGWTKRQHYKRTRKGLGNGSYTYTLIDD